MGIPATVPAVPGRRGTKPLPNPVAINFMSFSIRKILF
jgi:hypothetical protein